MRNDPLIERRQELREATTMLASHLTGDGLLAFTHEADQITEKAAPAPGRSHMRAYLKANVIRD